MTIAVDMGRKATKTNKKKTEGDELKDIAQILQELC